MGTSISRLSIQYRWVLLVLSLLLVGGSITGFSKFNFDASVRSYFTEDYRYFQDFTAFEGIYGREQRAMIMISPAKGDVFDPVFLQALAELTEKAWMLPFVGRVDSLANYQHTVVVDDDLFVENFISPEQLLTETEAAKKQTIALNEPALINKLISANGEHVSLALNFNIPEDDQAQSEVVAKALYALMDAFEANYEAQTGKTIDVAVTGNLVSIYHNIQIAKHDFGVIVPLMFLLMFVMLGLIMKTISGTITAFIIAILSTIGAFALGCYAGVVYAMMTFNAVIIIITITIAHCIHIIKHFQLLYGSQSKKEALLGSLSINALPVCLTSVTTLLGFLSLNLSGLPPVISLGNIAAMGVLLCWVFSFTVLPALVLLLPFKKNPHSETAEHPVIARIADYVINNKRTLLVSTCLISAVMLGLSLQNIINDRFSELIEKPHVFRTANEKIDQYFGGLYNIDVSMKSHEDGGITSPEYLKSVDVMTTWLRDQPEVKSVSSMVDLMKRLNVNLHNDDPAYYVVPEDKELAAQYLLLYEMSLPFGLDLTNQISMDKSESRIMTTFESMDTREIFDFTDRMKNWQEKNLPEAHRAEPTSVAVMWANLSYDSLSSSFKSALIALLLISAIMVIALKSFKYGLISLVPNVLPAAFGFGFWYLIKGEINMGLMSVMIITIGIVVDDTVHFLSKYKYARETLQHDAEDAVRYAFQTVGSAIITTTLVLVTGFSLLILSQSTSNTGLGILTALILFSAMILDFLLLPVLLLYFDRKGIKKTVDEATVSLA